MYIEKIHSPADLRKLEVSELKIVASEVRDAVLNRVSRHGGHVGPNLGFTEATVALHYVFDTPTDKLVFDVSHQTYPHKILTGRAHGFLDDADTRAISGYSSPSESPEYDNFEVGHTSTAISLATGLQKGRDVLGGTENIVAIVGDGSLSGKRYVLYAVSLPLRRQPQRRRGVRGAQHGCRTGHEHHHRG